MASVQEGRTFASFLLAEAVMECDGDAFPCNNRLFYIFVSLPMNVTSAKRTFSNMRMLETWLRIRAGKA